MENRCQRLPVPLGDHLKADQVFAGGNQTFLISAGEVLSCGDNSCGQLGLDQTQDGCVREPTEVEQLRSKTIDFVSTGPKHTLAWSSALSQIWAFGDNSDGSLGLGDQDLHCGIARLESFSDAAEYGIAVSSVAVGEGHSLVLAHNQEESGHQYVFGWGENSFNQLGEDGYAPQEQDEVLVLVPHQVLSEFSHEIASLHCFSNYSAVATCDGKVFTWGRGDCGRLGYQPPLKQQLVPRQVDLKDKVASLALGGFHALALTHAGQVYSWGSGANGQLGHDKLMNDKGPMLVAELADFKITLVSAGTKHSLCLTSEGEIFGWGCNQKGQLGLGDVKGALKPKRPKNVVEK